MRAAPKPSPKTARPAKQTRREAKIAAAGIPIPRSTPSKPLHVRGMPTEKRAKKERIHKNLRAKSPWYQALRDPSQGAGIKIPDDVAVETGTLQCVTETQFSVGLAGNGPATLGGIRVYCLHPNKSSGPTGENYQKANGPASTATTISWLSGAAFATNAPLQAYANSVRVVSAAMYVESEASLSNASGEMILSWVPYRLIVSPLIDDYRNAYGTSIMPLNVGKPMCVRWTPVSIDQQTYTSFYNPDWAAIGPLDQQAPNWMLSAIVTGAPAGVSFRVRIVVNYEFIPNENSIDILSANPSPVDETDVNLTEAWVAEETAVSTVSTATMARAPGAGVEEQHPQDGGSTGFGMFAEVLTELVPYALEGLSLLL